jgi:sulfotransferase family protein
MTRIAYIMGHGYSGSTLLTFLLGTHPEIATVGELGIAPQAKTTPEEYLCSCHSPVRDCDFWKEVGREMKKRGHEFDIWDADLDFRARGGGVADVILRAVQRGPVLETARSVGLSVVPRARREFSRILSRIQALAEIITGIKKSSVFLDASKRPERATLMQRGSDMDIRVIHLVRDGRAVAWSTMKNLGVGPEEAARSWVIDNCASEAARRYFPASHWLRLRHEDVCADPLNTLMRVHAFLDVTPKNGYHNFRGIEQHIIGNRMRLSSTSEIRLDDRWKTALTPEQMAVIESKVQPLNRSYGYGDL